MRMLKLTTSIGAAGLALALASTGVYAHGKGYGEFRRFFAREGEDA